ncbi:MAG: homoserine O-acetyltransferase [Planctomycetia bacterium]|nr:homoserine O-acetyltransferase [Planctomycetia bacterium]
MFSGTIGSIDPLIISGTGDGRKWECKGGTAKEEWEEIGFPGRRTEKGRRVLMDDFQSSDSVRSGRPLRHVQYATFPGPVTLTEGGVLPEVTVAYETYGELNAARDNAVLICHALTGDSHVASHPEDPGDEPGWWEILIGPGRSIDTNRYFVICPNVLGGCRGTTGPMSVNPATGRPYGADFPVVRVEDIVAIQKRLMDRLGIGRLRMVLGGSLGGAQALEWAKDFPDSVCGMAVVASAPRLSSQALAFDVVGRNAIQSDPAFHGGQYYDRATKPLTGLAIARMLGHITYLSPQSMQQKFNADRLKPRNIETQFETRFSVGSYLAHQGDKFGERFDPNSYNTITMSIDLFDLGDDSGAIAESLKEVRCQSLILSFTSDWLFPAVQSRQIVRALLSLGRPVSYCNIRSDCGHDAFLLEDELPVYGGMIRGFLDHLTVPEEKDGRPGVESIGTESVKAEEEKGTSAGMVAGTGTVMGAGSPELCHSSHVLRTPIEDDPLTLLGYRLDYDEIIRFIPPGATVLDLGCGSGGLLAALRSRGHRRLVGVELDEREILACIAQGFEVIQANLNRGLEIFEKDQFDYVVLSQTLQTIMDVERLIREMLRVGRRAIVTFPNIAYHRLRDQLAGGHAPRPGLYPFQWYDTVNVRSLSIADFEEFCAARNIRILHSTAIDTENDTIVSEDPNRNADVAIHVLSD